MTEGKYSIICRPKDVSKIEKELGQYNRQARLVNDRWLIYAWPRETFHEYHNMTLEQAERALEQARSYSVDWIYELFRTG